MATINPLVRLSRIGSFCLIALAAGLGCSKQIGDACSSNADCDRNSRQTCDLTLPSGYCTLPNCSARGCPGESACIGFQSSVSVAEECRSLQSRPRLQRTACMLECSSNSECRGGYVCLEIGKDPWAEVVLEERSVNRVCVPEPPAPATGESGYCRAGPDTRPALAELVEISDAGSVAPASGGLTDAAVPAADAAVPEGQALVDAGAN